jgi:hypothetical protein
MGNLSIHHRFETNNQFRQIIKLENMKFCDLTKNLDKNPWFKELLIASNLVLPGLIPEKCPIVGVN